MKNYQKPVLKESNILMEGVYAGSGDVHCPMGRRQYNPGADKCQDCLGVAGKAAAAQFSCPLGLPHK